MENLSPADVNSVCALTQLSHLELGDCLSLPDGLMTSLCALTALTSLRLERARASAAVGELRWLARLRTLELVDVQFQQGFGDGLAKLEALNYLLVIPDYKDEVRKEAHGCIRELADWARGFLLKISFPSRSVVSAFKLLLTISL